MNKDQVKNHIYIVLMRFGMAYAHREMAVDEILARLFPEKGTSLGDLLKEQIDRTEIPDNHRNGYVVFADGRTLPTKVHAVLGDAVNEAKRLAMQNKDRTMVAIPVSRIQFAAIEEKYPLF